MDLLFAANLLFSINRTVCGYFRSTNNIHSMLQLSVCLLLVIGCFSDVNHGQQKFCHRRSSKPGLHFTDQNGPATLVIGCETEWLDMICCTSNFRKIVWYQSTDKTTWWEFMSANNNTRKMSEDNQVATIPWLQRQTDSGFYRCVAHGDSYYGEIIDNVAQIDIRNCSWFSDPPIPLQPRSNLTYREVSMREDINIMCLSFSGVNCDQSECHWGWYKRRWPFNDSDISQIPVIPEDDNSSIRIRINKVFRRNGLRMEAVLNIAGVTSDDYSGAFVCYASNTESTYNRIVRLIPRTPDVIIPISAAALGGFILVMAVIVPLVNHRVRADLDVRIWWLKRQLRRAPQCATDYDVTLLSLNEIFALYIKETLQKNFHLNVLSMNDLNPGSAPISCLPECAKRSRSVLVVMTPEVREDKEFVAIIGEIISDSTPVFVLYRADDADMDNDKSPVDRNIVGAMTVNLPLRWPGRVFERATTSPDGPRSSEEADGVEYWEGSGSRKVRIFWKQVRLSLLKMEKSKIELKGTVRTTSLSEPLVTPTAVQPQCPKW